MVADGQRRTGGKRYRGDGRLEAIGQAIDDYGRGDGTIQPFMVDVWTMLGSSRNENGW